MTTWINRVLLLAFFVNCLQLQAWAGPRRSSKKRQALEQRVEQQVTVAVEQSWKTAKAELEAVLKEPDLSSTEKQFARLELQIINTQLEELDALDSDNAYDIARINRVYHNRIGSLKAREDDLEVQEALRLFYQEATQDSSVAWAVFGLHNHAQKMATKNQQEDSQFNKAKATLTRPFAAENLHALPQDNTRVVTVRPNLVQSPTAPSKTNVLKLWEDNKITLEDVVEYADPIVTSAEDQPSTQEIADAAMLLFSLFYAYNAQADKLDEDTLKNTAWLAQRLKYRAAHQLHVLQQQAQNANPLPFVQARGNLLLLTMQLNTFLSKHSGLLETKDDTQLPQYRTAYEELKGYNQGIFSYANVGRAISAEVKQALQSKPNANSAAFGILAPNLAYAIRFAMFTEDINSLIDFMVLVNKDGNKMHGENEQFVSAVFGSIFDTLINYSVSENTQRRVKQLLICAAAPKCTYDDEKLTNAVNVRTQALAVSSMLRQVAKNNKVTTDQGEEELKPIALNKALFNDRDFRTAMARFAVDLYWPTQRWNVTNNDVKTYGLQLDELQKFGNYLATMYESFLPVPEPKSTFKTIQEGIYEGCLIREVDTQHLANLKSLNATRQGSITRATSVHGKPCKENPASTQYGGFDNLVVTDSRGYVHGITALNPYNRDRAVRNFVTGFVTEVATWYMWGAAFKAMGYLWKAVKISAMAGRVAVKAPIGLRTMRFQSKFSQAWKYSTRSFEKEAGIVNLSKQGETITVELHRPGFQGYVMHFDKAVLEGHSLKSLKGRVLLRRAMHRKAFAQYGKAPKTAATGEGVVANASSQIVKAETTNELAQEILRPLTKAEQQAVREEKAIVDAVKTKLAKAEEFEVIPSSVESPFTLYRPTNAPEVFTDLSTGLPEKAVLDPVTGNVAGELSGNYAGTIVSPFTKNTVAYNIAAGMMKGHSVPLSLTGRTAYNMFPVLRDLNGLTKFVATLSVTDQLAYHLYTKPYMEKFAKQQDEKFTALSGLKKDPAATDGPKNILDQVQSLQTALDTPTGATISGAFLGANQALNTLLPQPIQALRRDLFQFTTDVMTTIDGPVTHQLEKVSLGETIPGAAQIALLPVMLASDPTPQPSEAAKISYMTAAHQQRVDDAIQKHSVTEFTDTIDKTLKELNQTQSDFLKSIESFKPAPQFRREVKRTYRVYEQSLKRLKLVAQNDFEGAQKSFEDAFAKFINTQGDIATRAIAQFVQHEKQETLQSNVAAFKEGFQTLFTEQDEKELQNMILAYYNNYQAAMTQFYTAAPQALKTGKKAEDIQQAADQELVRTNNEFMAQRNALINRLNDRADQLAAQQPLDGQDPLIQKYQLLTGYAQESELSYTLSLAEDAPEELRASLNEVYAAFNQDLFNAYASAQSVEDFQNTYSRLVVKRNQLWDAAKAELLSKNAEYKKWLKKDNSSFSSQATKTEING